MSATYLYHHNLNFTGVKLFSAAFQTEFKQFKSLWFLEVLLIGFVFKVFLGYGKIAQQKVHRFKKSDNTCSLLNLQSLKKFENI